MRRDVPVPGAERRAGRFETPLLRDAARPRPRVRVHGRDATAVRRLLTQKADVNVPQGESESFYTALKLVGAPVELLTIDGQDHSIVDHSKRVVWSRSIMAWFDKWLKGQPAWWDDLYSKKQVK